LFDLLYRWQEGRLPVDIDCVISNHDRPQDNHVRRFLQRHGIPYHYLPTTSGDKSEQGILELIQSTDFVVLARYMQILSESFLKAYGKDIINIHHGLLPSFKGGHPSRQVPKLSDLICEPNLNSLFLKNADKYRLSGLQCWGEVDWSN
jgi:formyltetrahydrofolate deformylase